MVTPTLSEFSRFVIGVKYPEGPQWAKHIRFG